MFAFLVSEHSCGVHAVLAIGEWGENSVLIDDDIKPRVICADDLWTTARCESCADLASTVLLAHILCLFDRLIGDAIFDDRFDCVLKFDDSVIVELLVHFFFPVCSLRLGCLNFPAECRPSSPCEASGVRTHA